mmetsp:Transcript_1167/g.2871  ORF Transcript_1167/g.2871 Transcript_1167/m.2871 type:complete len:200 (-) Transcript_1167:58-657(-)
MGPATCRKAPCRSGGSATGADSSTISFRGITTPCSWRRTLLLKRITGNAFTRHAGNSPERWNPSLKDPFFLGSDFSMVDMSLAPFWQRILWVGTHYRGLTFPEEEAFKRLDQWWEAVAKRPSVARTLVCKPRLQSSYRHYATNLATSNYGRLVQKVLAERSQGSTSSPSTNTVLLLASCLATSILTLAAARAWNRPAVL